MSEDIHEMTHGADKHVALLIALLALLLFFSEAGGKIAQHHSTESNIEHSDTYNFYQAKKIRATMLESNAQQLDLSMLAISDPKIIDAIKKQSDEWKITAKRYVDEPKDGMTALQVKADNAGKSRDLYNKRLEHYELASGLAQIAIVIASASIITGIAALVWLSGLLGMGGVTLLGFGYFAPEVLKFFGGH